VPWTPQEERQLSILDQGRFGPCRTSVDLKDKWRNLEAREARRRLPLPLACGEAEEHESLGSKGILPETEVAII